MNENRANPRIAHRQGINITFGSGETMKAYTENMSNNGLLITCQNYPSVNVGDIAEIVVVGIEDPVPRNVKVIRLDGDDKIALQFLTD